MKKDSLAFPNNLKYDLPAGLVVFLVALPLCLGIALASGAPLFSGILAGIVGGLVVPLISRSNLSVSGPAAGLTAIVIAAITTLGSFEAFLAATVIGGVIQIVLGFARAGTIAYFFPSNIIKGMLAAIGLILILKQLPHAIGYDAEQFGLEAFLFNGNNTFSLLASAFANIEKGALLISIISLAILIMWDKTPLRKIAFLPAALVVVILSIVLNEIFASAMPALALQQSHLVSLPEMSGPASILKELRSPDWSFLAQKDVWIVGLTIGIIASIESLLSVEAVDQLDPFKRQSPLNRELLAQGAANVVSGLIGGLPLTAVIVRSSANVAAGGRTRVSAFTHGIFLLVAVILIAPLLNKIPLAALASVLLMVGYKLTKPALYRQMYKQGKDQFLPFIVTVVAILLTDLLIGIGIGLVVGVFFVIRNNFHTAIFVGKEEEKVLIRLRKDVSFLNKASLVRILNRLPEDKDIVIDGSRCEFIDHDIKEIIDTYREKARIKGIHLEVRGFEKKHLTSNILKKRKYAKVLSDVA